MQDVLCNFYTAYYIYIYLKRCFCGPDKVTVCTYTYRIYIHRVCGTVYYILYKCMYVCMYVCMCGHTGSCCTHCVNVLAIGL
jgi:hypothetical protein